MAKVVKEPHKNFMKVLENATKLAQITTGNSLAECSQMAYALSAIMVAINDAWIGPNHPFDQDGYYGSTGGLWNLFGDEGKVSGFTPSEEEIVEEMGKPHTMNWYLELLNILSARTEDGDCTTNAHIGYDEVGNEINLMTQMFSMENTSRQNAVQVAQGAEQASTSQTSSQEQMMQALATLGSAGVSTLAYSAQLMSSLM